MSATRWFFYYLVTFFIYIIPNYLNHYIFKMPFFRSYIWMRIWSKLSLVAFGTKLEVLNNSNESLNNSFIFAGNHRSWIDHFCIFKNVSNPVHILLNEKFSKIFLFGRACLFSGCIPVKEGKINSYYKEKLTQDMLKKHSLCLFFEGTRGSGRDLLPIKKGAFYFSARYKAPLKPFFLINTEEVVSKKRNFLDIRPATVVVVFEDSWSFSFDNLDDQIENFIKYYTERYLKLYEEFSINNVSDDLEVA